MRPTPVQVKCHQETVQASEIPARLDHAPLAVTLEVRVSGGTVARTSRLLHARLDSAAPYSACGEGTGPLLQELSVLRHSLLQNEQPPTEFRVHC